MFVRAVHAGIVSSLYMFKVNGCHVKFASTLYASKIVGFKDRIKFQNAYLTGDPYPEFTLKTSSNLTFTRLNKDEIAFTLDSASGIIWLYEPSYSAYRVSIGNQDFYSQDFVNDYSYFLNEPRGVFRNETLTAIKSDSSTVHIYWWVPGETPPGGASEEAPPPTPPGEVPVVPPTPPTPSPYDITTIGVLIIVGIVLFAVASYEAKTAHKLRRTRPKWQRKRVKAWRRGVKWKRPKRKTRKWEREELWK